MKFMKLGTRPDTFFTKDSTRSISSDIATDVRIKVGNCLYLLHKFPLLSKCAQLQSLYSESKDAHEQIVIELTDVPGSVEAFDVCVKFCYGITITVSALNFVPVYCAASYLHMRDDVDRGNLLGKLNVFLRSCILRRWKDALLTFRSTARHAAACEELGVTSRCVDALASLIVAHPDRVDWASRHTGWWEDDISELDLDLYLRIMLAVRSAGTVSSRIVGDAVRVYALRWLPDLSNGDTLDESATKKYRSMLERIVSLLPWDRGSVSCGILLRLLRASNIVNASLVTKTELARRAGVQLDEATVADLLIPCRSCLDDTTYDVDIVMTMVEEFMIQGWSPPTSPTRGKLGYERRRRSRSAENFDFEGQECGRRSSCAAVHGSKLRVAKLVDRYLLEVARDANLPMEKVVALAEAVPDFARPDHDDLYRVIDTYLAAHPNLDKSSRKQLCRILNCKKLSAEACTRAARNELLPLRVLVQVLFFEQARAAVSGTGPGLPSSLRALLATTSGQHDDKDDDGWSVSGLKCPESKPATLRMKLAEDDNDDDIDDEVMSRDGLLRRSASSRFGVLRSSIPTKPRRMLSKLWTPNRSMR